MSGAPAPTSRPRPFPAVGLAALLIALCGVGVAVWAEMTLTPESPGFTIEIDLSGEGNGVTDEEPSAFETALRIGAEILAEDDEPPPPPPTALGMEQIGWFWVGRALGGVAIVTGLLGVARHETVRLSVSTLGLALIAITWPASGMLIGLYLLAVFCPWIFEVLGAIASALDFVSAP